ncbi:MAG: pilus assembly protein N-terminal domain-containing protein [Candidatus Eisenbacteria bacterium]|nr:pilus assembly protein N-terminal domain-containing protein [Candidatus Eisenbacteria bacterium]
MPSSDLRDVMRGAVAALLVVVALGTSALAADMRERLRIPVGHAEVIPSPEEVRTVAIAEPTIADAAVGSARTVVVNGKAVGTTSLVVYNEGGRYRIYEIEVYVPNSEKQVLLHVSVAELNDNAKKQLGLDFFGEGESRNLNGHLEGGLFSAKASHPVVPVDPREPRGLEPLPNTDGILKYAKVANVKLTAAWQALEEKGDIRTLANPSLVARSGEKATFLSGGEFPLPVLSGTGTNAQTAIQFKEFGVRLEFTPTVLDDGSMRIKVQPEVSEIDNTRSVIVAGFVVPTLAVRRALTTVTMNAGEYLVIGGLKQTGKSKVVRKVPILGHIPLLGWLFTNVHDETSSKDLLVVVTPELVEAASTMPALPTDKPAGK